MDSKSKLLSNKPNEKQMKLLRRFGISLFILTEFANRFKVCATQEHNHDFFESSV
jgi:hypothetical protein